MEISSCRVNVDLIPNLLSSGWYNFKTAVNLPWYTSVLMLTLLGRKLSWKFNLKSTKSEESFSLVTILLTTVCSSLSVKSKVLTLSSVLSLEICSI